MLKIKLILFFSLIFISKLGAQNKVQVFKNAGFKVMCGCDLYVNSIFIDMTKQNGINNILAAYICAENKDNSEIGVVNNINVTDEIASFNKINPSNYAYFEKKTLETYALNLKNGGFNYNYITFKGVSALEYTFEQQGLPTKALFFLKNKKTYLIQVATRKNLSSKYNLLKYSFEFL
jgi:hypothetical protein